MSKVMVRRRDGAAFSKTAGASPFVAGLSVTTASGAGLSTLRFARGAQVAGNFYKHFDSNQGWIAVRVTPAWDGDDGEDHTLLQWSANGYLRKTAAGLLVFSVASGVSVSVDVSAWNSGTAYRIDARWDADNTLDGDGGDRLCLSINDSHTFARTSDYTPETPAAYIYIGTDTAGRSILDGVLSGLTIYRRPGWDGANGINAGNGDELASTGDRTILTGSWDVLFCLPTNATTGALAANDAWSHPSADNLLSSYGWMASTAWDGWTDEGAPADKATMDASQRVFGGGYQYEASTDEGMYRDVTVTTRQNIVVRAVASSDSVSIPQIVLYDQTNGQEIGKLTGSTASVQGAPDVLVLTAQMPSNSAAIAYPFLTGVPSDGDTITIGDYVYVWRDDISDPAAGQINVLRSATNYVNMQRLGYAINGTVSAGSYAYGSGTGVHPSVTSNGTFSTSASPAGTWLRLTAKTAGAAGNSLAISTTCAGITLDDDGFTDGSDDTDCVTLRIKLVNAAASGTVYWHQVEVLNNMFIDPSIEHGNGNPWLQRTGDSNQSALPDTTWHDASTSHSGGYSIAASSAMHQRSPFTVSFGTWLGAGCWAKTTAGATANATFCGSGTGNFAQNAGAVGGTVGPGVNATDWTHTKGVIRAVSAHVGIVYLASAETPASTKWWDDAYTYQLDAVALETL